ncbi:hypothetical protein ABTW72_03160 [Micromonospora sp. NPDC127501]|uniref:hypothetical protein n=1 Tax=Micromonospora sp. NPDC127501 TaxID=3154872 RepID=UPI003324AF18
METFVTTVVGLVGGLLLSVAFWYFTSHIVVPSIQFHEFISKRDHRGSGKTIYRFRIKNPRRKRGVIDVSMQARMHYSGVSLIPKTDKDLSVKSNRTMLDVPLDNKHLFRLAPGARRVIWLDLHKMNFGNFPFTSEQKAMVLNGGSAALETLFALGDDAYLRIEVLCYDEWSGSRRYYSSREYRTSEIKLGVFDGDEIRPELSAEQSPLERGDTSK